MPSKQTSTLRKDEFATPNAPNKSVAGMRNIVQADINVSFMAPQTATNRRLHSQFAATFTLLERTPDATDGWLAPPAIAITSSDSLGNTGRGRSNIHSDPFLRLGLNGIRKSLGR
jgi:hypothetical protein